MTQHRADRAADGVAGPILRELAAVTAALVEEHDTVGTVGQLLAGCARAVEADAAGLLLANDRTGELELLASTSHRAQELELYQLHSNQGPCIEASLTGAAVSVYDLEGVRTAWPELLEIFKKNKFTGAHASPLRWHGSSLGALGLFFVTPPAAEQREPVESAAATFADVATLTVIHAGEISVQQLLAQTRAALAERVVIEQAKGVLAFSDGLDMDAAFDQLVLLASEQNRPITHVAAEIVTTAATGTD
jgi:hypothetical protein